MVLQTTNMSQHVEFFHSLIFHLCEDQTVIPFCETFKNYLHLCRYVMWVTQASKSQHCELNFQHGSTCYHCTPGVLHLVLYLSG